MPHEIHLIPNPHLIPAEYRVEEIDTEDGGVSVAIFSGPKAEERATWFAGWLRERGDEDQ